MMIVCAGQSLIDCIITENGSMDVADDIVLSPGGEAFNEACVFAALGDEVYLSSAIGDDHAGSILKTEALQRGIHIFNDGYSGRTPVSLLTVDSTGNRKSKVSKVHDLTGFTPTLPTDKKIACVSMGSLFRPPFLTPEACYTFAEKAKSSGAILLADTKMPKGTDPKLSDYADTLALLDFITPNEQESEHYTGYNDPEKAARVFHSLGVQNVIIKLSDHGCYISPQQEEAFYLPAYKVDVVDGIGAGDTFAAGLLHSLIAGKSLKEAAVFASACAALCVGSRGAVSAIHSPEQVEEFLSNQRTACSKVI